MRKAVIALSAILAAGVAMVAPANASTTQYLLFSTNRQVQVAYVEHNQWVNKGVVGIKQQVEHGWLAIWPAKGQTWSVVASSRNLEDGVWMRCEIRVNGKTIVSDDDWGTTPTVSCG